MRNRCATVVGYHTVTLNPDTFYMLGTDFVPAGSTDNQLEFDQFITGMDGVVPCAWADHNTKAATIYRRVGENYKYFYYINNAWSQDEDDEEEYTGWCDGSRILTSYHGGKTLEEAENIFLNPGEGIWFKPNTDDQVKITFDLNAK